MSVGLRIPFEGDLVVELESMISSGGEGEVYRVVDRPDLAVKVANGPGYGSMFTEDRNHFEHCRQLGARAMAARRLPVHELPVALPIALPVDLNEPAYLMRLVTGVITVKDAATSRWQLESTTGARLSTIHRLSNVAAELHARGVFVNDVNSGNFLVSESPSDPRVWFIDSENYNTDSPLKHPQYAAPERDDSQHGETRPSELTDRFQWAVIFYELLAGRLPWNEGAHHAAHFEGRAYSHVLPRVADGPELPPCTGGVIEAALSAISPAGRPALAQFARASLIDRLAQPWRRREDGGVTVLASRLSDTDIETPWAAAPSIFVHRDEPTLVPAAALGLLPRKPWATLDRRESPPVARLSCNDRDVDVELLEDSFGFCRDTLGLHGQRGASRGTVVRDSEGLILARRRGDGDEGVPFVRFRIQSES